MFALSLSEVMFVDWYTYKLYIDPDAKFPTKVNQHPVTKLQNAWFNDILNNMEQSHVIQQVLNNFIKNLSSTNLAPKEAGKMGFMQVEILWQVNAKCIWNKLPPFWQEVMLPGKTDKAEGTGPTKKISKWQVCHAFNALNKVTQVPAFPAGNLKAKQELAAGYRWASITDMIGWELVNWIDNICMPGDVFEIKLLNLHCFFERCCSKSLSLSPSKTKLFLTEALFAGAVIGPQGIKPNLAKIAAMVNWPTPQTVQQLMGFLGLANYFWYLIANYGCITAPLYNLTADVKIKHPTGSWQPWKGTYKQAIASASLKDRWGPAQQKAFVTIKCLLSKEPLLKLHSMTASRSASHQTAAWQDLQDISPKHSLPLMPQAKASHIGTQLVIAQKEHPKAKLSMSHFYLNLLPWSTA
jgi:hypothetical protein